MSKTPKTSATVLQFPEPLRPLPAPLVTASERALGLVVSGMLQQLGPTATYNRLVDTASDLRNGIGGPVGGRTGGRSPDKA